MRHQSLREPEESHRARERLRDERGAMGRTPSAGGCTTSTNINDSGLKIFTREQTRNDTLMERVERVREIANVKSLDLAVLDAVQQPMGCDATDIVCATD